MSKTASLLATVGWGAGTDVDIHLTGIIPDPAVTVLKVRIT